MAEAKRARPWYAVALVAGFGGILGAGTLLGLNGKTAHGEAQAASPVLQSPEETQRWRERMEAKLDSLTEKVARIEGELKGRDERR